MPTNKQLPKPIADLIDRRKWPKGVPLPKPGPYSSHARWKGKEDDHVREYYLRYGAVYLARLLGRSPEAVWSRAQLLGVDGNRRRWTADELALLKKQYGRVPTREIARQLGRPHKAVANKAGALGLTNVPPKWTRREHAYLRKHYKKLSAAAIAEHLGRPVNSVMDQAKKLGLARTVKPATKEVVRRIMRDIGQVSIERIAAEVGMSAPRVVAIAEANGYRATEKQWWKKQWTAKEDAYLRKQYATTRQIDIAGHLGCSLAMVANRARTLGLPKKKKHTRRDEVAAQQGRKVESAAGKGTASARSLGTSSAQARSQPRRWTEEEDRVLRKHWERLSVAELGERLGREHQSVRQRLSRLGLTRRRTTEHIPWSDRDDRTLSRLYGSMPYADIAAQLGRTVSSVASRIGRLGLPERDQQ